MNTPVRFRSAYDREALTKDGEIVNFGTVNNDESLTQQADAEDADINVIVKRFARTGQLPQVQKTAMYGDFTSALDYKQCHEQIHKANLAFGELPANVRKRFGNDPAEFIEFMNDPDNAAEMIKLGLAEKPPLPQTDPAPPPAPTKENP